MSNGHAASDAGREPPIGQLHTQLDGLGDDCAYTATNLTVYRDRLELLRGTLTHLAELDATRQSLLATAAETLDAVDAACADEHARIEELGGRLHALGEVLKDAGNHEVSADEPGRAEQLRGLRRAVDRAAGAVAGCDDALTRTKDALAPLRRDLARGAEEPVAEARVSETLSAGVHLATAHATLLTAILHTRHATHMALAVEQATLDGQSRLHATGQQNPQRDSAAAKGFHR